MEISLEKLINLVTAEVVKELKNQGVQIIVSEQQVKQYEMTGFQTKSEKIDMSKYKSPVLTERHIRKLHELTGEVIIPKRTIITPKAKELIKERHLLITFE